MVRMTGAGDDDDEGWMGPMAVNIRQLGFCIFNEREREARREEYLPCAVDPDYHNDIPA